MEILLDALKEIIIKESEKITTDKILINQFTDTGTEVIAVITPITNNDLQLTRTLVLWTGQAYINAGQYTDTDVINRIKELI